MVRARNAGTVFLKRREMAFFEGCPVGWGGFPTGAGLVDGGLDQEPWFQGRVVGGSWKGWQRLRFRGGGHGPQGRSKFRNVCRIFVALTRTKRRKMSFFEGCPVVGGVPTGAGLGEGWGQGRLRKLFHETCQKHFWGSGTSGQGIIISLVVDFPLRFQAIVAVAILLVA